MANGPRSCSARRGLRSCLAGRGPSCHRARSGPCRFRAASGSLERSGKSSRVPSARSSAVARQPEWPLRGVTAIRSPGARVHSRSAGGFRQYPGRLYAPATSLAVEIARQSSRLLEVVQATFLDWEKNDAPNLYFGDAQPLLSCFFSRRVLEQLRIARGLQNTHTQTVITAHGACAPPGGFYPP